MDVRDHAHHRQPLAGIVHAHAPAERRARPTRKVLAHDALADDCHFRRARRVPCGESRPASRAIPIVTSLVAASKRERR